MAGRYKKKRGVKKEARGQVLQSNIQTSEAADSLLTINPALPESQMPLPYPVHVRQFSRPSLMP
jgi:hypothetical protein